MNAPTSAMPASLLAKTPRGAPLSLERHCADTEEAASLIFHPAERWSRNWFRFFRFSPVDEQRFLLNLRVACLFHDIGKANEDFQAAVTGRLGGRAQRLRHEHISALILSLREVREWLEQNRTLDVDVITAAVLSHHLKAADKADYKWAQVVSAMQPGAAVLRLHLGHPDVRGIFARVQAAANLPHPPALPASHWAEGPGIWADALSRGTRAATDFRRKKRCEEPLLLATKAGLIVADSVASGVVRVGERIADWTQDVVRRPPLSAGELRAAIIDKRIAAIEKKSERPFEWHRFQTLAAAQGERSDRSLLLAGCGAGKTLAAYKWAESVLARQELGRVIFLYPTRGTATEGFRDYVSWAPEGDAALLHGTARYELEAMAQNPDDSIGKKKYLSEAEARLFALGLWSKRFFSATVDQFLGFLEHNYTGMCLLPVLADSAIILDEIHSYDRRMFDDLKAFLEHFSMTVLCMTATLPCQRRKDLIAKGLDVFPLDEHRAELLDLEHQECRPRYCLRRADGFEQALVHALTAYRAGGKVLWVVNTVERCQAAAIAARREVDGVLIYHSRFRLEDRNQAHKRTVEAFKADAGRPALAITTQVCEMSLDLDADVLITELAPVPSLVQRLGRSNRSTTRDPDFRADVLWYEPPNHLPYAQPELAAARRFLAVLDAEPVSQRQLAEGLEAHSPMEVRQDASAAAFLTGGYYATPGSLRDIDDYTHSSVLDSEVTKVAELRQKREPYDGFLLPAPRSCTIEDDEAIRPSMLPKFLKIVPAHLYDPTLGLRKPAKEP